MATAKRSSTPPPTKAKPADVSRSPEEVGASGTQNFGGYITGEDYNAKLAPPAGFRVYEEMRKSDPQVRGSLQVLKQPLLSAMWAVQPPKDPTPQEQEVADFCQRAIFERGAMVDGWDFVLRHALLQLDFGCSTLEKIWTLNDRQLIVPHRLAPRLPKTLERFNLDPQTDALTTITQLAIKRQRYEYIDLPVDRVVHFVHDREGDNYFGVSVLRTAYKPWFYKDKAERADAIRIQRFGVGIPIATKQANASVSTDEEEKVDRILANMSSRENSWIRTTSDWDWDILTPKNGAGGATGAMESIEFHNRMIVRNVLADFMGETADGLNSGRTRTLADIFTSALYSLAENISQAFDLALIRPLCDYNFLMGDALRYPTIVPNDVTDVDVKMMADVLVRLGAAKFVTPDDGIEGLLREALGIPPLSEEMKGKSRERVVVPPLQSPPAPQPGSEPEPKKDPEPAPNDDPEHKDKPDKAQLTVSKLLNLGQIITECGVRLDRLPASVDELDTVLRELKLDDGARAKVIAIHREMALARRIVFDGRSYARMPNAFELKVFSLAEVPDTFDRETTSLVQQLATIRRQQLETLVAAIVKKDARPTGEFTDLRPDEFHVTKKADVERAIKKTTQRIAEFGAVQVRLELFRQGGPVELAAPFDAGITLDAPGKSKQTAKSALTTSAKIAAETETDGWFNRILETAARLRRSNLQGADLSTGILDALVPELESGLLALVKGEVHESFSIGRQVEATANEDQIGEVEYSCLLDANSCKPCEDLDGETFAFKSSRYYETLPPYKDCEGNKGRPDACRCVHLFHIK